MNEMSLEQAISQYLKNLGAEEQQEVLEFARALFLSKHKGVPGQSLLSFAGSIDQKDAELMLQAIERDCEKITHDDW